ncbi:MAG: LuxR C-terminal-related transcriptional regulator, partial [Actinomycetes bacterium]
VLDAAERVHHPAVLDQLSWLLDNAGERLRVLMTSRVDPPMPLHRYRLEGTLAEIRFDELAFNRTEVEAMLDFHDVTVPDATTREVLDHTEGWAAGVRLAALALQSCGQSAALDGITADYLLAEVFGKLVDSDRDFLLKVSLVDEIPAGLGVALGDRADADELLRRMSCGNTFVLPVRERPACYRIHPLFREFLCTHLERTQPAAIHDLHRRASDWFDAHGRLVSAVRHAAATSDWARAAALVVRGSGVGDLMLSTPTGSSLAGHLSAMPEIDSADVNLVRAAMAVGQGELDLARASLARCDADGSSGVDWSLAAAVVTTRLCDKAGSDDDCLLTAREARMELASQAHRTDPRFQALNALVLSSEGMAHLRTGNLDAACLVLGDAVQAAAAGSCEDLQLRCLAALALAEVCRGQLSRGQGLADTAERLAGERAVAGACRPAAMHLAHAWVALERQDLARAQRSLDRAGRLLETRDDTRDDALMSSVSALLRARLRDRGDSAGARCILENPDLPVGWLRGHIDAEAAGVGLLASVAELQPRQQAEPRSQESRHRQRAVTASQRVQELLEHAQIQWSGGDVRGGRSEVAKALSLAQREQIRRPFAHMPAEIQAMIRNDHALRSHASWLRPEPTASSSRRLPPANDSAPILEHLSARELEVLRHLSALRSTEEIAAEMFISVNTVKTHVRKILGKLSVSKRNDAVRRAWELNLV